MLTMLQGAVPRIREFHRDETGDAIQAIAVGAVGVLLSAVIFQTMSSVVKSTDQGGVKGLFTNFLSGLAGAAGKLIAF
jgi:Flp pilus assembly pilin Flp